MNIQLKKIYYKYINTTDINHYTLLNLTEEYINISKKYFNKYPNASNWINLNKELFDLNTIAEIDYNVASKKQYEIKKNFFENREIICKKCHNEEYIVCSDYFEKNYVEQKYHYGQYTDNVIKNIITDINNIEK
jgi:hypothetical protein